MIGDSPTLLVQVPPARAPERRYVVDVLLAGFLGLRYRLEVDARVDVRISVQDSAGPREIVIADAFFPQADQAWLAADTVPSTRVPTWANPPRELPAFLVPIRDLPVLFGRTIPGGGYCRLSETRADLGIDIFGSSFFLLTRYEEAVPGHRDQHDRFAAAASLAHREGFLMRPVVNEYVDILWSLIRWLAPGIRRRDRRFELTLSHDVDRPRWAPDRRWPAVVRSAMGDTVRRGDPGLGARKVVAKASASLGRPARDPFDTFDWIMELSERVGLTSAFYFMTGPTAERPEQRYSMDDPWIRSLVRKIAGRGHEIGLHPTYATYRNPELTRMELGKLLAVAEEEGVRQDAWGGRQHYLRWSNPETWQNWEDAGLDYDSTLGFADHVGFRCGVCYDYPVFNLRTRQALRLVERPLVVMDGSLFQYMGLSGDAAREKVVELAASCRRHDGRLTLLWHNSGFISKREKRWYRGTLEAVWG
jgi:hypothetical protein